MPGMDLLVEFFRHNAMMNQRLVEACRRLSPEQLDATATGTYGSVGATLVHIANAQEGYAARFLGTERPERLPEGPFPVFEGPGRAVRQRRRAARGGGDPGRPGPRGRSDRR